ncbi:hypothetical protein MNEG_10217, partial [Monoraphidium neglectum]
MAPLTRSASKQRPWSKMRDGIEFNASPAGANGAGGALFNGNGKASPHASIHWSDDSGEEDAASAGGLSRRRRNGGGR